MPAIRKKLHNEESLRRIAKRMQLAVDRVLVVAELMRSEKVDELWIKNQKNLEVAQSAFEGWTNAAYQTFQEWMEEHGRYDAEPSGE